MEDIERLCGEKPSEIPSNIQAVAIYCRVSSHEQKQKGDLERQVGQVTSYCVKQGYSTVKVYEKVGSDMSDGISKLHQLFRLIESRKINKVVVEHNDRRSRFMVGFLEQYFSSHGAEIEWIDDILEKTYEQELNVTIEDWDNWKIGLSDSLW